MMLKKNVAIKPLFKMLVFAIAINCLTGIIIPINAEETNKNNRQESTTANTNNGLPSHRRDGGTRGDCAVNSQEFIALIPNTAVNLTASTNPKLYFHVPQTDRSQTIEFVVRDTSDRLVYETIIETEGKSGIMSVAIPLDNNNKAQSLTSEGDYRWYLSNICNPEKRSQDIVLEGWIQQIELSAATQAKVARLDIVEQAKFYQEKGLWHDALESAATELQTTEGNITDTKWSQFLANIGLEEFVNKPLID